MPNASYSADDLKKRFGLEEGSNPGANYNASSGATDSDKTKDNKLLGAGYLSDKNYDRLKNSDEVKKAYASLNGQEAADKKFASGEGLSINALDGMFDRLTANLEKESTPTPEPEPEAPVEHSPEIQQAKERVTNYENDVMGDKNDVMGARKNDVMSGNMSQRIFEGANDPGNEDVYKQDKPSTELTLNNMDRISDKYNLNIDNGMDGIGTFKSAEPKSTEAAQSFLETKKTDLQKSYGFKPSTAKIQYGVN